MHIPVLLDEVVEFIRPKLGGIYVDGTLGYGGHAQAILEKVDGQCQYLGIDLDPQAINFSKELLAKYQGFEVIHDSYYELLTILKTKGIEAVDGILLDLGVSSPQLDTPERGFSFRFDGPLDMRFNPESNQPTAADLLNTLPEHELVKIIKDYGEERFAKKIAHSIVTVREKSPFTTTFQLVDLIHGQIRKTTKIDPATRTFQALRIAVNNELNALSQLISQLVLALKPGGRLIIISFHSLEDRIVKHAFKDAAKGCICPIEFPICTCNKVPLAKIVSKKPIITTKTKIQTNIRSRSAKMRVLERL